MSKDKTGGPAFPTSIRTTSPDPNDAPWAILNGMSLLDYFAGQIIGPLIISNLEMAKTGGTTYTNLSEAAKDAYETAEAMIKEKEKQNGKTRE